jgi:hypothetical protein
MAFAAEKTRVLGRFTWLVVQSTGGCQATHVEEAVVLSNPGDRHKSTLSRPSPLSKVALSEPALYSVRMLYRNAPPRNACFAKSLVRLGLDSLARYLQIESDAPWAAPSQQQQQTRGRLMKTKILGLLAVALLAGPTAANAVPVSAGDTVVWNFDLTGQTPAPPFTSVEFFSKSIGFDFTQMGSWEFFSDLDTAGTRFQTDSLGLISAGSNLSLWTDGIFSVRLTMISGNNFSVDPCVILNRVSNGPCVSGLVAASVPEPGTLALLGLGLLGLGMSRRKA